MDKDPIAEAAHAQRDASLPRVVIVAEHASARFGGEAILPLHYFRFLRDRGVEVWLVVHERTRKELEQAIDAQDQDRIKYIPDTIGHRAMWRIGKRLPRRVAVILTGFPMHLLTQWLQRSIVRKLVDDKRIDIVHEPIPVSPKQPSLMYNVGAPVIIGPMNGGMTFPPAFKHMESKFERYLIGIGRSTSGFANRLIPGKRRAKLLLVANERTRKAIPLGIKTKVIELVENGVDLRVWNEASQSGAACSEADECIRFLYMGRLIDLKAIDILLEALSVLKAQEIGCDIRLDILGDGDERARLENLTEEFGLDRVVEFHGFLPQDQCAVRLAQCDALVLPSLHECGGAVVLEAMAMSKPVIATDWGGPADYLDERCGILLPPDGRESLISGFAKAMRQLAESKNLRDQLGRAGRVKVEEEYDWNTKINQVLSIYRSVRK